MLRIATIGTSMITDDFIQVVNANDQATFVGTLSRDADRGAAFTAEHGGERNFTALDELASADDVDAVYIGSPNALHHEQALACIAGGKHVIVEKPISATDAPALEDFRPAEAAGSQCSRRGWYGCPRTPGILSAGTRGPYPLQTGYSHA